MSITLKNLLIITDRYPNRFNPIASLFVKRIVDQLKFVFNIIYVYAYTPYLPSFFNAFPRIQQQYNTDIGIKNYSYDNVYVSYLRSPLLPNDFFRIISSDIAYKLAKHKYKKLTNKPDLIHSHFIWPSGYIALRFKLEFGIKYIVTVHGHDIYDIPFRNKIYFKRIKKTLNKSEKIITVSHKLRQIIINNFQINDSKIVVVPNGYDNTIFFNQNKGKMRSQLGLNINDIILLSVGRLSFEKGFDLLIQSMSELIYTKKRNMKLFIIGSGPEAAKLLNIVIKKGLEKFIIFLGQKDHLEISKWMNACDLIIIPSRIEGNPVVMFEALGCGKPIVATRVGGIPEILNNTEFGILVDPENIEDITKGIELGLSKKWDTSLIMEYSSNFTWKNIAYQYGKIYDLL